MPCCSKPKPLIVSTFLYPNKIKADYLEPSCFPCCNRNRNKNFLTSNGRVATSVWKAKSFFRQSTYANKQLSNLKKDIVGWRTGYLKGLKEYKITQILVTIEKKDKPVQEDMFKWIKYELKFDLQSFIDERIENIESIVEDITEYSELKQNLNNLISVRKVKNLVRSDLVVALKLFIQKSKSPKSMYFINEFIKFLLKNNDIKESEYTDLRQIINTQIETRINQILKNSSTIDNNVTDDVETFMINNLSNLQNYKLILLKNHHNHCRLRRFISSRLIRSYPKNLIDTTDKIFTELMEKATSRIRQTLAKSYSSITPTTSIQDFKKLSKATCLAMSLLIDPVLRNHQKPIVEKLFVDTANLLSEILSTDTSPLTKTIVRPYLILILQKNKILQSIDNSYLDVEKLLQRKKLIVTVQEINDVINKKNPLEEQENKKHQTNQAVRDVLVDTQIHLQALNRNINQIQTARSNGIRETIV